MKLPHFAGLLAGSIMMLSSGMAAAVNDKVVMTAKPAKTLAEYELFTDASARIPDKRLISYDLNNPLFTDYAVKYRYVYVPRGSGRAPYQEKEVLNFPVGSVLVKTFAYPADLSQPEKDVRFIETRLLIHKESGWKAYPYVWNEAQTEARIKVAGKRVTVQVRGTQGQPLNIDYAVPNMNQCKGCHINANKQITPIGPKIRNLNKRANGDGDRINQIDQLRAANYLTGGPSRVDEMPRVPNPFDPEDGDVISRARSYLDGNCAHCHAPGRPADTSGLYLDYPEERQIHWGLNKPPVAAGRGSGGLAVDIKPGDPDASILLYRLNSIDPGIMMPELGRSLIHTEGVELVRQFILALED